MGDVPAAGREEWMREPYGKAVAPRTGPEPCWPIWREHLLEPEAAELAAAMRQRENTGRPLGDREFIQRFGAQLGRDLLPRLPDGRQQWTSPSRLRQSTLHSGTGPDASTSTQVTERSTSSTSDRNNEAVDIIVGSLEKG